MLKLYKTADGTMFYWETWDNDEHSGVVHWGPLGDRGKEKIVRSDRQSDFHAKIQVEVNQKIEEGYRPIDDDDHRRLIIEFDVNGMGTKEDIEKRERLHSRMNETLGWTGLGHCDGGSIGSGTMEVCCFVVDFELAKAIVEKDLARTEFANYTKVYDEDLRG